MFPAKQTISIEERTNKAKQAADFLLLNYKTIIQQIDTSDKTIKKYTSDANLFINFLQEVGLTIDTYRLYKKYLRQVTTISAKTKNCKLVAAKVLLKELFAKGLLTIDITANVKCFKVSQEHVKDGLSTDQVKKVKKVIDKIEATEKRERLQAIFCLLACQGLRQFEVLSLSVEDLRLADSIIFVQGKGRDDKERIDLHPKTKAALLQYLSTSGKRSGFLFTPTSNNSKGKAKPMTTRALRKIFTCPKKGIFALAGFSDRSLHGFRHYFVTTFLEVTSGDILMTQRFSRHKSIQAVKMYDDRQKKKELLPTYYKAFA